MYNGTVSIGDSADINILKQEVELIAAINTQLGGFSSLKSTVANVWEVILGGKSILSGVTVAIKQMTSAGNELNFVTRLGASLMSMLSKNTTLYAAATKVATVAKQSFAAVGEITAGKIAALTIAITTVVAAISTFVKWINRTNEAGEVAKASAEGLVSAHEKLSETVTESAAAYNRTTAALDAAKDKAYTLTARLEELQANTARTEAEQAEMARITGELTDKYSGLNGMIDENTGALAGNAEQWNAVMNTWIRMQKACRNGGFPFRQVLV